MTTQPDPKPEISRPIEASLEALSPVLAEYTEALGVPVCVEISRRRVVRPRGRRGWYLHPFALPGRPGWLGLGPEVRPTTFPAVCGYALSLGRRAAWSVTGRNRWGRPLQDGEGQTVGLLLGTDVYVLFDLLGQEPPVARLLGRAILDLSLEGGYSLLPALTGLGPATLEARLRRLRQATEMEGLRASALWRARRPEQGQASGIEAGALEAELPELEVNLRTSGRQMRDLEHRLLRGQRRLSELEQYQAVPDALERDFDRIADLPGVVEVRVSDGALQVFTEPIVIEYGFRLYRLGRFRLDLHFDGRVFLRNLTDRYETYDHPHVENGRACLGNIQEWVQRLLGQREFAAATEVLLQYLRTVNPADWRKAVTFWAEVSP
ncbi:MAG: hypothetical protein HYV46_02560 [candidate division NC10 bacterium]|nr:hypothetical protein [candidate division NC10 bacterium]